MNNLFFLEFILTKKCNMACEYCDIDEKGVTQAHTVDIDWVDWVVKRTPVDNLFIEMTGGEPGLLNNLPELVDTLNNNAKVQRLQLMSNGLVRRRFPEVLNSVDMYNEHLVYKISGKEIIKFYDSEFDDLGNGRYVIVLDEVTVSSILENYDHFEKQGLFDETKFWLKTFVPRVDELNESHKNNILALYHRLNTSYAKHWIKQLSGIDEVARQVCKKVSFLPNIDVNARKIIHCGFYNYSDSITFDCTEENLTKLANKTLFKDVCAPYCDDCYLYYPDANFLRADNKANRRTIITENGVKKFI